MVVRDANGQCMGAVRRHLQMATYAFHVEALALRIALELLHAQQRFEVDVESYCSLLVAALDRIEEDVSEVGRIVENLKELRGSIQSTINIQLYFSRSKWCGV